jgi:hypothetical protein
MCERIDKVVVVVVVVVVAAVAAAVAVGWWWSWWVVVEVEVVDRSIAMTVVWRCCGC